MKLIATIFTALNLLAIGVVCAPPFVLVLGTGQDAGVPQMGCESPFCRKAWRSRELRQMVSSVALVDPETGGRWIFDATPDLPEQFEFLKQITGDRSNRLDGIFLTHAHIGHYTGLMYLGRESMNTRHIPVFAMPRMRQMLEQNAPWSQLVGLKNVALETLSNDSAVTLTTSLSVEPFLVPHRDEFSETVGFHIRSAGKSLIFIPDIDKWEKWKTSLAELVKTTDFLILDGTFFADGEISRPMSEVPHPFVTETMNLLSKLPTRERSKVFFSHFNHSNPLVQGNVKALQEVRQRGFRVANRGMRFNL